jgi:hypothetical protein
MVLGEAGAAPRHRGVAAELTDLAGLFAVDLWIAAE